LINHYGQILPAECRAVTVYWQVDRQLAPLQLAGPQAALTARVVQMCQDSRDNTLPRLCPLPLLRDLNACLPHNQRFDERRTGCTVELLIHVLEQLAVMPGHIVTHRERGTCNQCRTVWEQVDVPTTSLLLRLMFQDPDPIAGNLWCLQVALPRVTLARGQRDQLVPLSPLLMAHLAVPANYGRQTCQTQGCVNHGQVTYTHVPTRRCPDTDNE
jgi:hypothetical protein